MIGLYSGIRSHVVRVDGSGADDTILIFLLHGTYVQQQILIGDGWINYAEHTDAYTYTLRIDVVEDVGGTEEGVVVNLQTVVLLQRSTRNC